MVMVSVADAVAWVAVSLARAWPCMSQPTAVPKKQTALPPRILCAPHEQIIPAAFPRGVD